MEQRRIERIGKGLERLMARTTRASWLGMEPEAMAMDKYKLCLVQRRQERKKALLGMLALERMMELERS